MERAATFHPHHVERFTHILASLEDIILFRVNCRVFLVFPCLEKIIISRERLRNSPSLRSVTCVLNDAHRRSSKKAWLLRNHAAAKPLAERRAQPLPLLHEGVRREAGVHTREREKTVSRAGGRRAALQRSLHRVADETRETPAPIPKKRRQYLQVIALYHLINFQSFNSLFMLKKFVKAKFLT